MPSSKLVEENSVTAFMRPGMNPELFASIFLSELLRCSARISFPRTEILSFVDEPSHGTLLDT